MSASQEAETVARCPMRADYNPFSPDESKTHAETELASIVRQDPVFFNPTSNWWTVAGYDELREVLRDTKRFSSTASILWPVETSRSAELAPSGAAEEHPTLINNDPPEHRRIRRLTNQAFTPKAIASWGPAIEARVAELIDGFIDKGRCEFVSEFAEPLPIVVIMELLGIPDKEYDNVMHWSESLLMTRQPDASEEFLNEQWYWNGNWSEYFEKLVAERRREPRDDLVSELLAATDSEDPKLDDEELRSVVSHLLIAGNETTRLFLTTLAMRMIERPDLVERMADDEELIDKFIEEELRNRTPSRGLFRVATEDCLLGEATIRAGDILHVCYSAANHDERMFENADEFELDRPNIKEHVGFGRGIHFCIGAPLARLESKIAVREMAKRLPNLRRADDKPLEWPPNVVIVGPKELNIAWDTPAS